MITYVIIRSGYHSFKTRDHLGAPACALVLARWSSQELRHCNSYCKRVNAWLNENESRWDCQLIFVEIYLFWSMVQFSSTLNQFNTKKVIVNESPCSGVTTGGVWGGLRHPQTSKITILSGKNTELVGQKFHNTAPLNFRNYLKIAISLNWKP